MKKLLPVLFIAGAFLSGCAQNTVSEDKYSGFLSDYSILTDSPTNDNAKSYVASGVDWSQYSNVMVDKVLIITPDNATNDVDQTLLVKIADRYQALLKQKLSQNFTVVDQAGPGTLRVQAAITSVYLSYDDMKAYQYIPIAAAVTGISRASGASDKRLRVVSEVKVVDSVNGKLLAEGIDLESGDKAIDETDKVQLSDVAPVLDFWAGRISSRLANLVKK